MKTFRVLLSVTTLGMVVLTGMAADKAVGAKSSKVRPTGLMTNYFLVEGMHCNGCAGGLRSELKSTRGVSSADVVLSNRTATVVYDPAKATPEKLLHVIQESGFKGALKP